MKMLICLMLVSGFTYSKNLLFIGDSHTAGYFGQDIHKMLSNDFDVVATYGHSSSAAYHWINPKQFKLTGGKYNALSFYGKKLKDPKPIHWRTPYTVPKYSQLMENIVLHPSWKEVVHQRVLPDVIVFALGANDARAISNSQGVVDKYQFKKRSFAILKMIEGAHNIGAKCIWVGPPNGIKKSQKNQETLYKYLKSTVGSKCRFISSNHYVVNGCDGVHFNCRALRGKATKWAREIYNFIIKQ